MREIGGLVRQVISAAINCRFQHLVPLMATQAATARINDERARLYQAGRRGA